MIDAQRMEELADKLAAALPSGIGPMGQEVKNNLRAVLQSQLPQLGLVNREEFEAAREMLRRTRERVEELEARIDELEQQQN